MSRKKFIWSGPCFTDRSNQYVDLALTSPFESHDSLSTKRQHVASLFPHLEEDTYLDREIETLFCPLTFDAEPFFATGVEKSYFNHVYELFTVLFYVIREYTKEFKAMVDGVIIPDETEYKRIQYDLNKVWTRVLSGGGSGVIKGQCSPDEMIRMGSLFYMLQRSCDQSKGLVIGEQREFLNEWGQKSVKINFTDTQLNQYKHKLSGVTMSGMEWSNFFFRHIEKTDSKTLWFYHLPNFLSGDLMGQTETEFDLDDLFSLMDKVQLITNRGGYFLLTVQDHEEIKDVFQDFFNFTPYNRSETIFRSGGLWMNTNSDGAEHSKLITVSNYVPVEGSMFRRL